MNKDEVTEVPVPLAIRQLAELHNNKIKEYQQVALNEIQTSSLELMTLMGLNPSDGWRLDLDNLKFVKVSKNESIDGNS